MPLLIPDTLQEIPFYLKAEEIPRQVDVLETNVGRYEFFPTDSLHIFFSVDNLEAGAGMLTPGTFIGHAGMEMPFSLWVNSIFFLLFVACFVVFSLFFRKDGIAFIENFTRTFSLRRRRPAGFKRQVTAIQVWGEFFLVIQTMLFIAIILFTFLWDKGLSSLTTKEHTAAFAAMLIIPSVGTLLKLMMYRVIGTFFMPHDMKHWINFYYRLVELLGIFLFIPVLFYVFLPEGRDFMLAVILFVFIISRLVMIIRLLNIFVKNKVGWLYFFVYLCGTEIAPFLLCYRGMLSFFRLAGNIFI